MNLKEMKVALLKKAMFLNFVINYHENACKTHHYNVRMSLDRS